MRNCAPLILAIVLLLPVLYVGSYLALVTPGKQVQWWNPPRPTYRVADGFCSRIFWHLEQIDRRVRRKAWEFVIDYDDEDYRRQRQLLESP